VVVIDYKAGGQALDELKLEHGLDLQLLAYLGVLGECRATREHLGAAKLVPAGAFYVGVGGYAGSGKNRREVQAGAEAARQKMHRHQGRFRGDLLEQFHAENAGKGDQFKFKRKQDGDGFCKVGNEALDPEEFLELVSRTRQRLIEYAREIYAGDARPWPYRIKKQDACGRCDYASVCRFDRWLGEYRVLKRVKAEGEEDAG
jgi:ATP-dependent helicase/nuclease subunit B